MAARWAGMDSEISIHALREEGDCPRRLGFLRRRNFYPRPPRGGRPRLNMTNEQLKTISIHALREEGDETASHPTGAREISIHALREEGDPPNSKSARPSAKISIHALREEGDGRSHGQGGSGGVISIHALREEGDCKNGEKYLRFCFIIKRSAQIWKSLSKNIRKNSCDLHRTA